MLVIGLGNLLMRDDGVGIHAVRKLRNTNLPSEVELVEGGSLGLDLFEYLDQYQTIVVIDAVDAGVNPGSGFILRPEQIIERRDEMAYSFHDIDVATVLSLFKLIRGCLPHVFIIGIQPKEIAIGTELSQEVESCIHDIVDTVRSRIVMSSI